MKLSIVIPCYNERNSIPLIFKKFDEVIKKREIEVIMINNGSTDDSQELFDELIPKYHFAKLVKVDVNQGYGYGILQGLKIALGDYIGWTHADMQTDPGDVIRAYDYIQRKGADNNLFVKGNRRGRPFLDVFYTFGMSVFESIIFRTKLTDINAQPNIFPRGFFERWNNPPIDFSLDLYAIYQARRMGLKIVRFPVEFTERQFGNSKWNTGFKSKVKFIKRTIIYSVRLKRREKTLL